MNETYAMKSYEQTFSVTPEQRQRLVQAKEQSARTQPQAASVLSSPALWVGLLAAFLYYRNK